jgi:hypothetical protein
MIETVTSKAFKIYDLIYDCKDKACIYKEFVATGRESLTKKTDLCVVAGKSFKDG